MSTTTTTAAAAPANTVEVRRLREDDVLVPLHGMSPLVDATQLALLSVVALNSARVTGTRLGAEPLPSTLKFEAWRDEWAGAVMSSLMLSRGQHPLRHVPDREPSVRRVWVAVAKDAERAAHAQRLRTGATTPIFVPSLIAGVLCATIRPPVRNQDRAVREQEYEIEHLYVAPDFQGRGVGERLLRFFVTEVEAGMLPVTQPRKNKKGEYIAAWRVMLSLKAHRDTRAVDFYTSARLGFGFRPTEHPRMPEQWWAYLERTLAASDGVPLGPLKTKRAGKSAYELEKEAAEAALAATGTKRRRAAPAPDADTPIQTEPRVPATATGGGGGGSEDAPVPFASYDAVDDPYAVYTDARDAMPADDDGSGTEELMSESESRAVVRRPPRGGGGEDALTFGDECSGPGCGVKATLVEQLPSGRPGAAYCSAACQRARAGVARVGAPLEDSGPPSKPLPPRPGAVPPYDVAREGRDPAYAPAFITKHGRAVFDAARLEARRARREAAVSAPGQTPTPVVAATERTVALRQLDFAPAFERGATLRLPSGAIYYDLSQSVAPGWTGIGRAGANALIGPIIMSTPISRREEVLRFAALFSPLWCARANYEFYVSQPWFRPDIESDGQVDAFWRNSDNAGVTRFVRLSASALGFVIETRFVDANGAVLRARHMVEARAPHARERIAHAASLGPVFVVKTAADSICLTLADAVVLVDTRLASHSAGAYVPRPTLPWNDARTARPPRDVQRVPDS